MQLKLTKPQESTRTFSYCGICRSELEEEEVLVRLGLTGRQARVYLALLRTGDATARAISYSSQVNRQDIHRIINSLQQIGLVQKKITHPATFQATPITEALDELLKQKINELNSLKGKTKELIQKYTTHPYLNALNLAAIEESCLGVISEGDRGKKHHYAIEQTHHTIDIITSWSQFRQLTTLFEIQLQKALQKGIIIRMATQKPPNQSLPNWIKHKTILTQTSNSTNRPQHLKLKILQTPPNATFIIFDNTQLAIAFNNATTYTKGPHLWTNNSTLIELTRTHFNKIWTQTKTTNNTEHKKANKTLGCL